MALRAMAAALGALEEQFPDLKSEKLSSKELNQVLMQETLSVCYRKPSKKLDCLSAIVSTHLLGIFVKVDQGLAPWLLTEANELCLDGDILTRSWHSRIEQPYEHPVQTR